jgi:hypothetical protein
MSAFVANVQKIKNKVIITGQRQRKRERGVGWGLILDS